MLYELVLKPIYNICISYCHLHSMIVISFMKKIKQNMDHKFIHVNNKYSNINYKILHKSYVYEYE